MQLIPAKSDSTAGANGQLPAAEYNDRNVEIEKVITKSGQSLSAGITDQFSKAIFINAIGAHSMVDSGTGNTITLNPVTGGSGLVPPGDYAHFNGGVVCFNKATVNTGTAVTISPWGLTAKSLVRKDGSLPAIGDVIGECFVRWNNSADNWVLLRNETDTYKYFISASGAVAPKFANNEIEVDLSGGDISIDQLPVPDFIGQRIHIYGVGSGIGDIAGGTGAYVNGIFFTENTGGVFGVGISATEWRFENGITADYVSGTENIKQLSNGTMKTSRINTTISAGATVLSHSVGFANTSYSVDTTWTETGTLNVKATRNVTKLVSSITLDSINTSSLSVQNGVFDIKFEGVY